MPLAPARASGRTRSSISSGRGGWAEALFRDELVPRFRSIERPARQKLLYLNRARVLQDLTVPPGNRLEALRGDRRGQHSIRVDEQRRICFRWQEDGVHDVEIVDYH